MNETAYYPDEIANVLCKIAFDYPDKDTIKQCEDALYQLKAIAENPYNSDYYRTLYKVFETIANNEEA
jgi:hypothetical protein